jgi:RNA polymerase subunit RPABC4/transcription elongation factor Spt4
MAGAACPACGSTQLDFLEGRTVACQKCGMHFELGLCPGCGALVSEGTDICPACGRALSYVPQVIDRHTDPRVPHWLADVRGQAEGLKSEAAAASDARMQAFEEIDRKREAKIEIAALARRRHDRIVLGVALLLCAVILILCVMLASVPRT